MTTLNKSLDSHTVVSEILELEIEPREKFIDNLGAQVNRFEEWVKDPTLDTPFAELRLALYCLRHEELTALFLKHGGVLPSYNIYKDPTLAEEPIGFTTPPGLSGLKLAKRPRQIAGHKIGYPIGIPSSTLTASHKWIRYYAERGFDVLTYRTVRTKEVPPFVPPNWIFLPSSSQVTSTDVAEENSQIWDRNYLPDDPNNITMANSFGITSPEPLLWQEEVRLSRKILHEDQMLIVSVTGTTDPGEGFDYLVQDFVRAAIMAHEAGAHCIELNFSCPTVVGRPEGYIYLSPEDAALVSEAVYKAIKERPLIKIGYLTGGKLDELVGKCADSISGITAINSVRLPVKNPNGSNVFPSKPIIREMGAVSGTAIKYLAQDVVKQLAMLRDRNHYGYDILALGGVTNGQDFYDYLDMGADVVQSCTGAFINPELAIEIRAISDTPLKEVINVEMMERRGSTPPSTTKTTKEQEDEDTSELEMPTIPFTRKLMREFKFSKPVEQIMLKLGLVDDDQEETADENG